MSQYWQKLMRIGLICVVTLALFAPPAMAADDDDGRYREPNISYLEFRKPYIEWIAGTLIIIACVLIAFKNPHRTHLD